jgi:hypothetical protein
MRLASAAVFASFVLSSLACESNPNYFLTFYGYPDNDVGGDQIAYLCPGRSGYVAGGDGSYANPLTGAVSGEYSTSVFTAYTDALLP